MPIGNAQEAKFRTASPISNSVPRNTILERRLRGLLDKQKITLCIVKNGHITRGKALNLILQSGFAMYQLSCSSSTLSHVGPPDEVLNGRYHSF